MRKKKRQQYIDYDYEALYDKYLKDMKDSYIERLWKQGIVKSIYATKEIRVAEQLEVEIYPEFTQQEYKTAKTKTQIEQQRRAQHNLNEKNSRKMCERTIIANFNDDDIWATLNYSDEYAPQTMEQAKRDMKNYIRRLNAKRKKDGLPKLRYVYVTECGEKGRWHHHIVLDGDMGLDTVEEIWTKGRRNQVRRLHKDENGLVGLSRYITKPKKEKGKYQKTWSASKGLKKPDIKKNHYKFKQKDINEIVTGRADIEDKLNKWYKKGGYTLSEYEIRYNDINRRFYIYARLHKSVPQKLPKTKTTKIQR